MKPWLLLPPKVAHDLAPFGLQLMAAFRTSSPPAWRPFQWQGLSFPNRLGIAGGVDKDGERIEDWWALGAGFIEIGTVTPRPQDPNPGKIIDRDLNTQALWNRMGFPGKGMWHVRANLMDLPQERPTPIFVNIGKNRDTSNEDAAKDYAACIETLSGYADAFVVNISSPNTSGLRDLFKPDVFGAFLKPVIEARNLSKASKTPILLKLSPDLQDQDLATAVGKAVDLGINGFVATNTTLAREPGTIFPTEGGVSGKPLANRSKETLGKLIQFLGTSRPGKLIVSAGGVMSADEVFERLDMGADLVQVYTALIYEGPRFFLHVAQQANRSVTETQPTSL